MRIEPGATAMVPFDLYYMPYTHSLLGTAVWAAMFGLIVMAWQRDAVAATLTSLVVLSHWVLHFLTHRPDLTLAGGNPAYGLGLWNAPLLAIPLELLITLGAFWRSEEHTSELQSLMRISYAVFCLKKKKRIKKNKSQRRI